jgi:hypothetical protein
MTSIVPRALVASITLTAALGLAACGGGGDDTESPTSAPSASGGASAACNQQVVNRQIASEIIPIVVSSDLAVGEERFVVGLIDDATGQPLTGADISLTFYCYDNPDGTEKFTADPEAITLTKTYTHTHEDGTVETHEAGEAGAYVTYVDFDQAGYWGVEVTGTAPDGRTIGPARPTFSVNQASFGLKVGDPAPLSEQPIFNGDNFKTIDTSDTFIMEQHNQTIADAVQSARPTVIAFATPAFCQSQICGPIKEIFDDLWSAYGDQANFVHVEPYDVPRMRAGDCESLGDCLVPTVNEWRLSSEPWVFIVGADGNIAAKFDGIASYEEIEAALQQTLG